MLFLFAALKKMRSLLWIENWYRGFVKENQAWGLNSPPYCCRSEDSSVLGFQSPEVQQSWLLKRGRFQKSLLLGFFYSDNKFSCSLLPHWVEYLSYWCVCLNGTCKDAHLSADTSGCRVYIPVIGSYLSILFYPVEVYVTCQAALRINCSV